MTKGLYAIFDNKAGELIGGVQLLPADQVATRWFLDVAQDTDARNLVNKHLEDFDLIMLGTLIGDRIEAHEGDNRILTGKAVRMMLNQDRPNLEVAK